MIFPKGNYLITTNKMICDPDSVERIYTFIESKTLIADPIESSGGFLQLRVIDISDNEYLTYYVPMWNIVSIVEVNA